MCVDSGVYVPFRLTAHVTKAVFILQYVTDNVQEWWGEKEKASIYFM